MELANKSGTNQKMIELLKGEEERAKRQHNVEYVNNRVFFVTYYIMAFYFLFITSFNCPFPDKEVHWGVSINNA